MTITYTTKKIAMNSFNPKDWYLLYMWFQQDGEKGFFFIHFTKERAEAHFANCLVTGEYICLEYSFKTLEVEG